MLCDQLWGRGARYRGVGQAVMLLLQAGQLFLQPTKPRGLGNMSECRKNFL